MPTKLTISFEFDAEALKQLDVDLWRCVIFTEIPKLPLPDKDTTQKWGEIGKTEWKKIRAIVIDWS